jgi:ElaB/YqjD/DUF883 family membrane-anchored ribosome-binding protein
MRTDAEAMLSNAGNDARHAIEKRAVKPFREGKDKLLHDLKVVMNDAQALLKEATDSSAEGIAAVPAYLEDRLGAVKDNFHRAKSTIEATAKSATAATDMYVRKNPWKSLGFAAAVSIVLSCLLISACLPGSNENAKDEK